ncbi:hypothetical protein HQ29_04080 [Porphyromonas canoris]|uniref:subtilase family N-terminal domain-containing protein n=1 Tax=Porphyromonas canoris TaxID=36875 RepID=UPI00051D0A49|nr:subtilase family N-terminal domain-containing protein [Porphyromonas canoris]KGL52826.1 hypothetical protein HQ29_04080 [Porphyromonas canoris]
MKRDKTKETSLSRRTLGTVLAMVLPVMMLPVSCKNSKTSLKNSMTETSETATDTSTTLRAEAFVQGRIHIYVSEAALQNIKMNDSGEISMSSLPARLTSVLKEIKATRVERLFPPAGKYEERSRQEGLHRWFIVTFDKGLSPTKACEMMLSLPEVEQAEAIPEATMQIS